MKLLEEHQAYIKTSHWMSLPEVNGKENSFHCSAQASSVATIIDALYDLSVKLS